MATDVPIEAFHEAYLAMKLLGDVASEKRYGQLVQQSSYEAFWLWIRYKEATYYNRGIE